MSSTDMRKRTDSMDIDEPYMAVANRLPIFDPNQRVDLAFGNHEIWRTVLGMLHDSLSDYADRIRDALDSGDHEKLRHAAHKLYGASSYCGTPALSHQAKLVEQLTRSEDSSEGRIAAANELLMQIDRLQALSVNGTFPDTDEPIF